MGCVISNMDSKFDKYRTNRLGIPCTVQSIKVHPVTARPVNWRERTGVKLLVSPTVIYRTDELVTHSHPILRKIQCLDAYLYSVMDETMDIGKCRDRLFGSRSTALIERNPHYLEGGNVKSESFWSLVESTDLDTWVDMIIDAIQRDGIAEVDVMGLEKLKSYPKPVMFK